MKRLILFTFLALAALGVRGQSSTDWSDLSDRGVLATDSLILVVGNTAYRGTVQQLFDLWEEDSSSLYRVAPLLVDSLSFPFGFGGGLSTDTALCVDGLVLGSFYNEQDTLISEQVIKNCAGTGGSFAFKIVYDANLLDATPTTVYSGTVSTSGGETTSTSFTNALIPPNVHVWAEINGTPTGKATYFKCDYEFSRKRAK